MSKTLSDILTKIGDDLADNAFVTDRQSQLTRAINATLDDIDSEAAYDFQLEETNLPFNSSITGTTTGSSSTTVLIDSTKTFTNKVAKGDVVKNTTDGSTTRVVSVDSATQITCEALADGSDNTFTTGDSYEIETVNYQLGSGLNFKASYSLQLSEDQDVFFEYVSDRDFDHYNKVQSSGRNMYAITNKGNARIVRVNWATTERFIFNYFSHNMVLDDDGSTRKVNFADTGDSLLVPDNHWMTVVHLSLAQAFKQLAGARDKQFLYHQSEGERRLRRLKEEHGLPIPKPRMQMKVRSEWGRKTGMINWGTEKQY